MNHHRLNSLLNKYKRHEKHIKTLLSCAITLGSLSTHQHLASKFLKIYSLLNKPTQAHYIFNQIHNPDIVSWTCLINLYLHSHNPNKALSIFSDLVWRLRRPDGFSAVAALTACGRNQDFRNGRAVHGMIIRFELCDQPILCNALIDMYSRNGNVLRANTVFDCMGVRDVVSWTSLLNGFVKCHDMVSARHVFDQMPVRNVVSWTGMIVGCVRGKVSVNGLELFREMVVDGVFPTEITVVAVLSGCADIGALDFGTSVHGFVSKSVLVKDMAVNNALIDMYSKSGSLKSGLDIFCGMGCKDLFTWTTTISGLALHGKGRHAVELFDSMLASGLTPNMVTYVAVLSACAHSGLVEEGKLLFKNMIHRNGLKPTLQHYGCMVDLLGRAGCVHEAMELIDCMPMRPDAVIWRSLLSACLGTRDFKLAEMAAKKVIELEPDDDGVYILLWNFYRNSNKWDDASTTMKMMRSQRIKKQPGCSWIELNGIVHEFLAEDSVSNISPDMYIVLEIVINELNLDIDNLLFE